MHCIVCMCECSGYCSTGEEEEDQGTKDEDERHQGRKRSFAHVRGNWPTYVHIPGWFHSEYEASTQADMSLGMGLVPRQI